jgi:hypothetical protein
VTRLATVALALVALLTACATKEQWVYEKRAVTPTRLDHDLMACRDEARNLQVFAITLEQRADRERLNRCMERKGYSIRRVE